MHVHLLLDFSINSATDVDLLFDLSVLKYQLKISLIPEQPSNLTHKKNIIQFFNEIKVDCFYYLMALVCLFFCCCYDV